MSQKEFQRVKTATRGKAVRYQVGGGVLTVIRNRGTATTSASFWTRRADRAQPGLYAVMLRTTKQISLSGRQSPVRDSVRLGHPP
jgi:hypothetical protein